MHERKTLNGSGADGIIYVKVECKASKASSEIRSDRSVLIDLLLWS